MSRYEFFITRAQDGRYVLLDAEDRPHLDESFESQDAAADMAVRFAQDQQALYTVYSDPCRHHAEQPARSDASRRGRRAACCGACTEAAACRHTAPRGRRTVPDPGTEPPRRHRLWCELSSRPSTALGLAASRAEHASMPGSSP